MKYRYSKLAGRVKAILLPSNRLDLAVYSADRDGVPTWPTILNTLSTYRTTSDTSSSATRRGLLFLINIYPIIPYYLHQFYTLPAKINMQRQVRSDLLHVSKQSARELSIGLSHRRPIDYSNLVNPSDLYSTYPAPKRYLCGIATRAKGPLRDDPWLPYIAREFYDRRPTQTISRHYCDFLALLLLTTGTLSQIDPLLHKANFFSTRSHRRDRVMARYSAIRDNIGQTIEAWWKDIVRLSRWGTDSRLGESGQGVVPGFVLEYLALNEAADTLPFNLPLTRTKLHPRCFNVSKCDRKDLDDLLAQKMEYEAAPYYDERYGWRIPFSRDYKEVVNIAGKLYHFVNLNVDDLYVLASTSNRGLSGHYETRRSYQDGTEAHPIYITRAKIVRTEGPYCTHQLGVRVRNGQTREAVMKDIELHRDLLLPYSPMPDVGIRAVVPTTSPVTARDQDSSIWLNSGL